MWVISSPAAPPHVVPYRNGSKWEDSALSPARDRPASELYPQCRFTIWRWRGQTLPAQRYKLKKVQTAHLLLHKFSNIILINCIIPARFEGECRDAVGSFHPVNRNPGWSQKTDGSDIWPGQPLRVCQLYVKNWKQNNYISNILVIHTLRLSSWLLGFD